jgi:hypothetical protein
MRKPIGVTVPYRLPEKKEKRKWVGLTDEQIWQLVNDCTIGNDLHADKFAKAIEARLKELNT